MVSNDQRLLYLQIVSLVHASTVMSIDRQFHIIYSDSSQVLQVGYGTEERE
jgi:hypothetical protein